MVRFDIRPANQGGYLWRLLSDNNRTMATGADLSEDRADCLDKLRRAADAAASQRPRLVHEDDGTWSWTLYDGDDPVARSAAAYSRRIDCVHAIDRFVELCGELAPGAADDAVFRPARRR
ncbi:hypothetical protein [Glycomyces sp. MUSA5-2]|uniref:hypothetical protein n=1 Tax=Glycomyces sp. MUSA5-2 TaxID=2053002 RepID=UPI00300972BF